MILAVSGCVRFRPAVYGWSRRIPGEVSPFRGRRLGTALGFWNPLPRIAEHGRSWLAASCQFLVERAGLLWSNPLLTDGLAAGLDDAGDDEQAAGAEPG